MTKAQDMLNLAEDIEAVTGPAIMSDLLLSRDERELIISVLRAAGQPQSPSNVISPSDPRLIIAGIRQFGLASDGSDLRDLEAAISAHTRPNRKSEA